MNKPAKTSILKNRNIYFIPLVLCVHIMTPLDEVGYLNYRASPQKAYLPEPIENLYVALNIFLNGMSGRRFVML